ncbi:MAG: aminotransferase class V-fold PLP-dependent enzyme [Tabrizicola sp.]|uniref:pyridoxal-phosphate-dependent aminotransferase family protein n=1 Tax=Tabrizicola sp. TaxID=2005166 RepID=UPI002735ADDC|nr:aminotransferase class V-fold PLP-dependent enzyme [Tabrizicola sp.]MDP3263338.1 aminotransferase class V-fold PLP-dependent enzyme [Tabrizicola sp.]MDP3646695.1 aminotransferase class V-fold PLP-dependent enzyme [Paracoccaceae bacterium]MDZ4070051.1 aminotransferase class V-fold PLP-dependent enzyme [Tabrizicola sp.]
MRTGTNHLFIPGPTTVPEDVRMAMNVAMQDQRGPEFGALTLGILADLRRVFRTTTGQVMLFPGSGTGAWEAAITNTLNPGDRVLMARHGQFSALWAEMATRLGLVVDVIDVAWGAGVPVSEFMRRLAADRKGEIKAVFVTHNETATGVTSDVAAVRRVLDDCFHDALLFVDGVSSVGSIDFRMDEWGVDLAVTGSQKGLMCPAGLGILCVSEKAMAAAEKSTMRRAYFEFRDMAATAATGYFPYTPPTQILHGLRRALDRINAEGLDNVISRHARLAEGVRRGVAAWGLMTCAEHPSLASNTVTAIRVPEGVDAREVIRIGYERYNASFGSGLARLAGKVFRIGHLGDLNEGMCLTALAVAEMALVEAGADIEFGSGVAAAQAWYAQGRMAQATLRMAAE